MAFGAGAAQIAAAQSTDRTSVPGPSSSALLHMQLKVLNNSYVHRKNYVTSFLIDKLLIILFEFDNFISISPVSNLCQYLLIICTITIEHGTGIVSAHNMLEYF